MRCLLRNTLIVLLLAAVPLFGQDQGTRTDNPLAQLKTEVERVVRGANLAFTDDQEKAITLMMEDRRKASEDLFGDLMDFSAGPTRGQDADRLNSAIEWMRSEFLRLLQDYLTADQLVVWNRYTEAAAATAAAPRGERGGGPEPRRQNQTQYVRINNNAFTAEDNAYRNRGVGGGGGRVGGGAEVIQRGGAGNFHGNAQVLLKDESLNAGRRFASNKPPYQERQLSFDFGGPLIPGHLTSSFGVNRNNAENVDTIRATLADSSIYALGITHPSTSSGFNTSHTLQLSERHSLTVSGAWRNNVNKNLGAGGFVLPERAYDTRGSNWNVQISEFSAVSSQTLYEMRFNFSTNNSETFPLTDAPKINVTDAFSSGGSQNRGHSKGQNLEFSNLYTRLGEKLSIKAGLEGVYRKTNQYAETNFLGTFAFSSLDTYRSGQPFSFRVNRGDPQLQLGQWETGYFFQNDVKVTPRLTVMSGIRYEFQTNISDHNNIDPRVGLAYAIGRASVLRAGAGIFHQRVQDYLINDQNRLNGTHQYEIVIDNPSYPDAFVAGSIRNPSVRVTDPDLRAPYDQFAMASFERTFLNTLFVSASYDYMHGVHRLRLRNLNAPRDTTSTTPASCKPLQSSATCLRPLPDRGNIINLESSGTEILHTIRLNFRERFSIFNITANYQAMVGWLDSPNNLQNQTNVSQFGFSTEGLPSDSYNLRVDWGRNAQPVNTLNTTVNARLPLGLFLTGTMNYGSSRRYTVTTGKDDNLDSSVNDRPIGGGRSADHGPNMLNFDFNISKAFFLSSATNGGTRSNVNLFANMTNAFNRPNYGIPSGVMTSPNFRKSTNAGNPREIEAGMRFQF
jgi:hypothetical protein